MEIDLDLDLWPRQLEAFETGATEVLYGGSMESGKSHLARVSLIEACLDVPDLQCVLARKKVRDIRENHVKGRNGFNNLLKPLIDQKLCKITKEGISFFNGSYIEFVHCQDERQFDSAQGVEKHFIVFDEATQVSERIIRAFRTWCRMDADMKESLPDTWRGRLPRLLYTANPIGPGVPFFKRNFVRPLRDDVIKDVAGFKRQFLPARYTDNGSIDEEAHKGRVEGIGDERLAKALDEGDWDALTGEFFPEWDEDRHVVTDFTPPNHWFRFRTMDWGQAEPACFFWWAVSDGEPFHDSEGNHRWFPRGALICYNEWYICDDGHADPDQNRPAKGIYMSNADMARGVIERSEYGHEKVYTLTDTKPFQATGEEKNPADTFRENGCALTMAGTARVAGWSLMRERLKGSPIHGERLIPMIFFTERCKYARDYIPALPRHPSESRKEDAAEHGEATHACDAIRYACTAHTVIKDQQIPMNSRIQAALKVKPTMNKILSQRGHGALT